MGRTAASAAPRCGQSRRAPLIRVQEGESYQLRLGQADSALKGQGQGVVWQEMQKRSLKRPKAHKTVLSLLSLLFKKRKGLRDGFGVEAALAGASAKQAGRRSRSGERAAGRTTRGREGLRPGPGPPPHSLALLAIIEHDGVVVAA